MTKPPTQVLLSLDGAVAIITLFNPPMNVVTRQMTAELEATLATVQADESVRAVVLTGHGSRAFCSGSDIKEFPDLMMPGQVVEKKLKRQNDIFRTLYEFPKPTIAAVSSLAYGGGLEIAICCDLIIAEDNTRFSLPELNLGVFPSSGGTYRMARKIGASRTKELIFLGEAIDADTALSWGLINRKSPVGQSARMALSLAHKLARKPRLAMRLSKELIDYDLNASQDELIQASLDRSDQAFCSPECREGVRAFTAKQPPDFTAL